jgi:hypothetical protein
LVALEDGGTMLDAVEVMFRRLGVHGLAFVHPDGIEKGFAVEMER